jgi:hypothetical protein
MKATQYSESKTQKKLRLNVLNHQLNIPTKGNTEKQSNSSNQTPEFTLDSNTPQTITNTEFQMMNRGLSKLSVTPFISPHRKEKQSNFVNFHSGRSPQKYVPINDNDIVFSPHKMELKSNFIPFSGFKKSTDIFNVNFAKFDEANSTGYIKDSLFIKTRNQFKEMKNSQKNKPEE